MKNLQDAYLDSAYNAGMPTAYGTKTYMRILYNPRTGQILTDFHCLVRHGTWDEKARKDAVYICDTTDIMTEKQIEDVINEKI